MRLHVENLTINSDVPLPPNTTVFYLHNIKYLNSIISLNYTIKEIYLIANFIDSTMPLELVTDKNTYQLYSNIYFIKSIYIW